MANRQIHFLSGLPRSGSTLLVAILKQNIKFHAGIQSPLADMLAGLARIMSNHESELFVQDSQRHRILAAVADAYYGDVASSVTIFDSNRKWSQMMPMVATLLPQAYIFCCVRNPAWILDSFERLVQKSPLRCPKIFQPDVGTVFSRADALVKTTLGGSLNGVKQAWYGGNADRLVLIRYDSLVSKPSKVLGAIYEMVGEPPFSHDLSHVEHDEPEFDARLGLPGLHRVSGAVEVRERTTILPAEIFARHNEEFWNSSGGNPRNVTVL